MINRKPAFSFFLEPPSKPQSGRPYCVHNTIACLRWPLLAQIAISATQAVLKKIFFLGFGAPGLKIHVLKEHSCPASVLKGEGRVYNIFGARAFLKFRENARKHPKRRICFWERLMDFWPGSPASGVEKWIPGFFRASGN
jgi:hypothetical protein